MPHAPVRGSRRLEQDHFSWKHTLNWRDSFCTRWAGVIEQCSDAVVEGLDGARRGFSKPVFELGKDLLDGVEIGTVWRQEEELGADAADGLANGPSLMAAKIT